MSNFEKITASPGALGEFLAALPVATGPWDESFRKAFCNSCKRKNCDGKKCPHQDKRNNPTWWLTMGGKPGEVPGLTIKIKAAFSIEWGREYYTVDAKKKQLRAPCACCDNTGEVTPSDIDWAQFGRDVEALCREMNLDYYIKDSLRTEMDKHSEAKRDG